ncbi:MAG: tRNA pseudouridine(38-40) synthase TruA [Gammaproteobacteria bacterium]|nr:tRNA pseudouridine(38-40) synthase TruA [Gammaproteobacteria bacterium]NNF62072.1 tRNA pseudouridine(38-40) synthase TruA [Gammaproteobacteria bacterium]NNM20683.1 tRNA pseudouridine(38-40) synthase TruA [Gammaproteobacteria bacterium]
MRYAAIIEYDGTDFCGWQRQPSAPSVQAVVESAFAKVADHEISTVCAGRTDAGVHARGQVVHFDSHAERSLRSWMLGANTHLPETVRVRWVGRVAEDFSARFSAVERSYRYRLSTASSAGSLDRISTWCTPRRLDVSRMRAAAPHFLGEHDFSAFRAANCQANTASRFVSQLEIDAADNEITIHVSANAFLKNMVRIMVGVIVAIGAGEREPDWVRQLLVSGDRSRGGLTAPAAGLCLMAVRYPGHDVPQPPAAIIAPARSSSEEFCAD